jgi:uncharacterized coiled-coil DUF342 family protein
MERKYKKASASGKESSKLKKQIKAQEKESSKFKQEMVNLKAQNDDLKNRIDELIKKQANTRPNNPPFTSNLNTSS